MVRLRQKRQNIIAILSLLIIQNLNAFQFNFHTHLRLSDLQHIVVRTPPRNTLLVGLMTAMILAIQTPTISYAADLQSELETYVEETESYRLKLQREPKNLMNSLKKSLTIKKPTTPSQSLEKELADSRERVLTLKAYLDEIERDLFNKNWVNLQVYIYTFADQENAFATLIDNLFPNDDQLDKAAREALSFEAQAIFLSLDDLREAAKDQKFKVAQRAYSRLILSYDRFLKAGDLYPTYDPITSTEIFFANTPKDTLRYSMDTVKVLDTIVFTSGPDMGRQGTLILIDPPNAVVKLSTPQKEVKYVKLEIIAKALDEKIMENYTDEEKKTQLKNSNKKSNAANKMKIISSLSFSTEKSSHTV